VQQLVIYPEPPRTRTASNPWPQWPLVLRSHAAHEEGGVRAFGIEVLGFEGDERGRVCGITVVDVDRDGSAGGRGLVRRPGTERRIDTDMVMLAIGFAGLRPSPLFEQLGVGLDEGDSRITVGDDNRAGPVVVAAGDAVLGAALVVDAIASGRLAAATCDVLLAQRAEVTA